MDNNNPTPPTNNTPPPANAQPAASTTPQTTPAAAPQPTPTPQVPVTPATSGNPSKKIMFLVAGLVVLILLAGGIYLFMNSQKSAAPVASPQPVVQATPAPKDTVDALDKDLSDVTVSSLDSDFSSLDQDLQQL